MVKGNAGAADTRPVTVQAAARLIAATPRATPRVAFRSVAKLLALAAAYFAAAKGGLALADQNASVTAVWAPTGIALAALVLWGRRMWPGVALGAFLANTSTGVPLITVLGISAGNTLEALLGATVLVHVIGFRPTLDRSRDVIALAMAATLSTMVSATLGVASLHAGHAVDADAVISTWRHWWLGDLAGALLVAPSLFVFADGATRRQASGRLTEGAALLAVLALVSWLVFSGSTDRTFLIFPLLAWAALRFRQPGVTLAGLTVAVIAAWHTAHHIGPFAAATADEGLLLSQTFVGVSALVSLLLAAVTVERERAEAGLREAAEARFSDAFEGAPCGMAVVSLEGRFQRVNAALCESTGYRREALEAVGLESLLDADELIDVRRHLALLAAGEMSSYKTDKRCRHASGDAMWLTLQTTLVRDANGEPGHFLTQMLDITDRRRDEERLRYMVDHDSLTGLLNRRSFERELTAHLERGRRYGLEGAALMLDLEGLKDVNDSFGHHVGDQLILRVAGALHSRLRETDILARLSGDEFVALLPNADRAGARQVARELLVAVRAVRLPIPGGGPRSVTASVGVAMIEGNVDLSSEDIMVNADLAMYAAKEAGRDRLAFYRSDERTASLLLEPKILMTPLPHGPFEAERLSCSP